MAGVGTSVVYEDDKIKVWEFVLEPGERTPLHTHELDYIFYVIDGSTLDVLDAEDNLLGSFPLNDGDVWSLRIEGEDVVLVGDDSMRAPATHWARNTGATTYREVLVEKK